MSVVLFIALRSALIDRTCAWLRLRNLEEGSLALCIGYFAASRLFCRRCWDFWRFKRPFIGFDV